MERMEKQTAVEWLEDGVYKAIENTSENSISYILEKLFNQANEMFEQQIIDAYWDGGQDIPLTEKRCEQYYKETYETK